MAYSNLQTAVSQYQANDVAGIAHYANPHKLIEMLLGGALDRLAQAKGGILRGDVVQKLQGISKAVAIIEQLRLQLDFQAGGEIARNLGRLYDYMLRRLPKANADDDVGGIDEVSALLREIKSAWDAIPAALHAQH